MLFSGESGRCCFSFLQCTAECLPDCEAREYVLTGPPEDEEYISTIDFASVCHDGDDDGGGQEEEDVALALACHFSRGNKSFDIGQIPDFMLWVVKKKGRPLFPQARLYSCCRREPIDKFSMLRILRLAIVRRGTVQVGKCFPYLSSS